MSLPPLFTHLSVIELITCNSLLIGIPKVRLSTLQTVITDQCLRSTHRSPSLPRFSNISSVMKLQLHWLFLTARFEFRVLILIVKSQQYDSAPKYLCDHIIYLLSLLPLSALSVLLIATIYFFLVLGQLWLKIGLLHLLTLLFGIASLLLFSFLFPLFLFLRLSLVLSLAFILELKCIEEHLCWVIQYKCQRRYINIYMQ